MELLFNLAWLVVSAALLASLQSRRARSSAPAGEANRGRRCLAVFLLSFLLLPAISMTDDLHAMTTMAEGERTYRKISAAQNGHLQNPWLTHPAMAASLPPTGLHDVCHGVVASIELPEPPLRCFTKLLSDRAPPAR
ncbi:MAG: hypothetical protein ACYDC6_01260 [Acidobacteriaceae bacterium]